MYLDESNLAQQYRGLIQGTQHIVGDRENPSQNSNKWIPDSILET